MSRSIKQTVRRGGRKILPWPERSSKAATIQSSRWWTPSRPPDVGCAASLSESSNWSDSRAIKSFKTLRRSLKKLMLTKWANFDIPDNAAGRRGDGRGFLSILKYNANNSFNVSVCCIVADDSVEDAHSGKTHPGCSLCFIDLCLGFTEFLVNFFFLL